MLGAFTYWRKDFRHVRPSVCLSASNSASPTGGDFRPKFYVGDFLNMSYCCRRQKKSPYLTAMCSATMQNERIVALPRQQWLRERYRVLRLRTLLVLFLKFWTSLQLLRMTAKQRVKDPQNESADSSAVCLDGTVLTWSKRISRFWGTYFWKLHVKNFVMWKYSSIQCSPISETALFLGRFTGYARLLLSNSNMAMEMTMAHWWNETGEKSKHSEETVSQCQWVPHRFPLDLPETQNGQLCHEETKKIFRSSVPTSLKAF
jgi:hypothetical protein